MAAIYATSAFAEQLGISKASLQNYITLLEEHGYEVRRNSRMHRQFTEQDLDLLRAFLTLYKQQGLKLKEAAQTVTDPTFKPSEMAQYAIVPATPQISQFEDLSNSMQLLATHVYGIEQQNMQLLTLIEEQRTQNELLIDQNHTLKQQLSGMMQHILDQANEPNAAQIRQLDRVEQQNSAIMSVLNKLNVSQLDAPPPAPKEDSSNTQAKGLFGKFFK
ncbi:MerR family transcriptional regulator [Solibacillus sp.]|uniref:MerR family transcriptional regulator n=1 Tax=Solibacillus sp. TaxID=1909654 RepID=UPI003314CF4C